MEEQKKVAFSSIADAQPVEKKDNNAPAFSAIVTEENSAQNSPESQSALAEGLPAWDIVPPQVVVRRR